MYHLITYCIPVVKPLVAPYAAINKGILLFLLLNNNNNNNDILNNNNNNNNGCEMFSNFIHPKPYT